MLNTLVKNVHNLGIVGGTKSGSVYTVYLPNTYKSQNQLYKSPVLLSFIQGFTTHLSTSFLRIITLLIAWLYPQPTVPTIKRTKEK